MKSIIQPINNKKIDKMPDFIWYLSKNSKITLFSIFFEHLIGYSNCVENKIVKAKDVHMQSIKNVNCFRRQACSDKVCLQYVVFVNSRIMVVRCFCWQESKKKK